MITRQFTFKFYNPNTKHSIPQYGLLTLDFHENLNVVTEKDINDVLEKVSENIKSQIKDQYAKDHRLNTKPTSFFCMRDENISLFDFKPCLYSPFKDDKKVWDIIHGAIIDKASLGYSNSLEVE